MATTKKPSSSSSPARPGQVRAVSRQPSGGASGGTAPHPSAAQPRGFAAMTPAQLAEVGRRGGRKSQQKGTGYRWTTREQQSAAGARGGQVTGARAHEQRVRTKRQAAGQLPKLPGVPRTR